MAANYKVIRLFQKLRGADYRKSIAEYIMYQCVVSVRTCINHFNVCGGHFKKWQPFPRVILYISATKWDVTTILI